MVDLLALHGGVHSLSFYDPTLAELIALKKMPLLSLLVQRDIFVVSNCHEGSSIKELVRRDAPQLLEINQQHCALRNQLFRSLYQADEQTFMQLLENNRDLANENNHRHKTLLQVAVLRGQHKAVKCLLSCGANPNIAYVSCDNSWPIAPPPLILAAVLGHQDIAEDLLQCQTLDLRATYEGHTLLHVLAHSELASVASLDQTALHLVGRIVGRCCESGVDIHAKNYAGKLALDYACLSKDSRFVMAFLKRGAFRSLTYNTLKNISPQAFINLFNEGTKIFEYDNDSKCIIVKFDYCFLSCGSKLKLATSGETDTRTDMAPLLQISRSETHCHVLKHPIILFYLYEKWKRIFPFYIFNLLISIIFTLSLTFHIYAKSNGHNIGSASSSIAIFLFVIYATRELLQIFVTFKRYVRSFINFLKVSLIITCIFNFIGSSADNHDPFYFTLTPVLIILLAYSVLTLQVGNHPYVAKYITMFRQVSQKTVCLLFLFSPILFAFAYSFYLFQIMDYSLPASMNNNETFSSFVQTLYSKMVIGEFELPAENFKGHLRGLILTVFIVLIVIVLTNLLNALAISDTKQIIETAEIINCISQVNFLSKVEFFSKGCLYLLPCVKRSRFLMQLLDVRVFRDSQLVLRFYYRDSTALRHVLSRFMHILFGLDPRKFFELCKFSLKTQGDEPVCCCASSAEINHKINSLMEQNQKILELLMDKKSV